MNVTGPDAAAVAERILVLDLPFPDDRDRLDPAVWVVGEARLVVGRVGRLEMVEEQEGIEVVEAAGADAPPEMDAGREDWLVMMTSGTSAVRVRRVLREGEGDRNDSPCAHT